MNVRIFWVRAMKCMCAQTRSRIILSSERVFGGMEFEPMLTPREKSPLPKMSPEEDRTRNAVDSEPKHYQLSYSGPDYYYYNNKSNVHSTVRHLWYPYSAVHSHVAHTQLHFISKCMNIHTFTHMQGYTYIHNYARLHIQTYNYAYTDI